VSIKSALDDHRGPQVEEDRSVAELRGRPIQGAEHALAGRSQIVRGAGSDTAAPQREPVASHRFIGVLGRNLVVIGLGTIMAGTVWLLALVRAAGTGVGEWALVPPVLLVGLGTGTCFGTVYDVTIGDIDAREAGSAGESRSAVQQSANAIGAVVVTTVYFYSGTRPRP
jgi:hypothetical protein